MNLNPGIEFCICTYNRLEYLKNCVASLLPQLVPGSTLLTLIDNGSTDKTINWIEQMVAHYPQIRYFTEPNLGLSHARNKAIREADHEWIFYLDDDSIPAQNLVEAALHLINPPPTFAAIGGKVLPATDGPDYVYVPNGFGEFILPYTQLTLIEKEVIRGPCMMIRTEILSRIGGFDTSLGSFGNTLRYGGETEMQKRLRSEGYSIAYAPSLEVFHIIRGEKLTLRFLLHTEYARRRDKRSFDPIPIGQGVYQLLKSAGGRVLWIPVYSIKLVASGNYRLKNFILDVLKPLMYRWGDLEGSLKYRQRRKP